MNRNILLDIIKFIVALFVIAVHCQFLIEYNQSVSYLLCNGLFRIAIPLFFCINGFYLFEVFKKNQITKWLKRVSILYVLWMLAYSYFWIPASTNPIKIIVTLLFGFNHLWYLAALLLGGFLLYKIRKLSSNILVVISSILFLIGYLIQSLGNFANLTEPSIFAKIVQFPPLYRNFLFYGLPFLSLGYIINRENYFKRFSKKQILNTLFIGFGLLLLESLITYKINPTAIFNTGLSLFILGPTILIFSFKVKVSSILNSKLLSSYSVALYLIHPFVIYILYTNLQLKPTILTLSTIILSLFVSYLILLLNRKAKFLL